MPEVTGTVQTLSALLWLAARSALVLVFVVAGVSKLRDRSGTRGMLEAFGMPAALAGPSAVGLPFAELAVAAALLYTPTARAGAVAATTLLALFTVAIAVNLAAGRRPPCRCFGQIAPSNIGVATLIRNVLLTITAGLVALAVPAQMQTLAVQWLDAHGLWVVLGAIAACIVVTNALLLLQIIAQQGRILNRLEALDAGRTPSTPAPPPQGLPIGAAAPAFELNSLSGGRVKLHDLLGRERPIALIFVSPHCGPCHVLLPEVVQWQAQAADRITIAVLSEGDAKDNQELLGQLDIARVLLQHDHDTADSYQAYGTPAALIVGPDGRVASHVAMGADAIRGLLGFSAANGSTGLAVGQPAPDFSARTSAGRAVQLSAFRGRDLAILFWNPHCGFCKQATDDIVRWNRDSDAALLVVSPEDDAELTIRGLRASLVVDQTQRIGAMFGAGGTPMALIVDRQGLVASEMAAGKDAVLALLQRLDEKSAAP